VRARILALLKLGTQTWLTVFVTTIYNVAMLWGVLRGDLPWKDYVFAIGPANTMVLAYWMGSETALRDPGRKDAAE
jgi:hypothetical protein